MHLKRVAHMAAGGEAGAGVSGTPRAAASAGADAHVDILLVEDDSDIQELLGHYLESAGHRVAKAGTISEAEAEMRRALPDLVLLDWMLPDRLGLDWACELRSSPGTRHVPIIMISARTREQDKIEGLDAGVDDYIAKPFSPREVVSRIAAVLRRRAPQLTDTAVEIDGLRLDRVSRVITADGRPVHVGPTEFRMLQFFMTHPERMHTRQQLVVAIWGRNIDVDDRTVDVNIGRLRETLKATHHDVLIETVRGAGYRLRTARRVR